MKRTAFITLLVLALFSFMSTSCYKVKDSIARVTVVDATTGDPVVGATVTLKPASTTGQTNFVWTDKQATTDANGVATFNFNEEYEAGQAGLLVLDIEVNQTTGVGIIKIEEQTTSEKTVEF